MGTKRRVTFVDLTVYQRMAPLVPSYLQAYAEAEPAVRTDYAFDRCVRPLSASIDDVAADLVARASDLYAFSCYVWNMGAIARLVRGLRQAVPDAEILLGGPQVSHGGLRYLRPGDENVIICNGEGERTFRNFLLECTQRDRDLARVRGLSFYREAELVVTPDEDRIRELDDIPSPFLGGYIEKGTYSTTVLETNRGCPYRCTFCYWGNKLGNKLFRFNDDRVREEIAWIARNGFFNVYIGDANWGILDRDVELTRWFVQCRAEYGLPLFVQAPSAKKKGQRVAEIGKIFLDGGLSSAQALAMQSTSLPVLQAVKRDDIGVDVYMATQRTMNDADIDTFVELIWPLPGETLTSFQDGVVELCAGGASSFHIFPLLLLPNTQMMTQRDEYGLISVRADDDVGEYELVTETNKVSRDDYETGLWFTASVLMLHNARCLSLLPHHLADTGAMSMRDLYVGFTAFCREHLDTPWSMLNDETFRRLRHVEFSHEGKLAHLVLHEARAEFDRFLHEFARTQPWWEDRTCRFLFAVDILNRPHVYSDTPALAPVIPLEGISVEPRAKGYSLTLDGALSPLLDSASARGRLRGEPGGRCAVTYKRKGQMPYMGKAGLEHNAAYCQGALLRIRSVLPEWQS